MSKARLWNVLSACLSLALVGIAHADVPRAIQLPMSTPVAIAVPGLQQALAVDPSAVRVETEGDVLTLTGLGLSRQTVVYAWTAEARLVFITNVVAPPPVLEAPRTSPLREAERMTSRVMLGAGFRRNAEGQQWMPITFGAGASTTFGGNTVTFGGNTQPFGSYADAADPMGSATVAWERAGYRLSLGDQPVVLAPAVANIFPLRGLQADMALGPGTLSFFGGARATNRLELIPEDDSPDALPSALGGLRYLWAPVQPLRVAASFAASSDVQLGALHAEWREGIWTTGFEAAVVNDRLATAFSVRRDTERLTLAQRVTFRTDGESALIPGASGIETESAAAWRIVPTVALNARVNAFPVLGARAGDGIWHVGGDWAVRDGLRLGGGFDRSFDGDTTIVSGMADVRSASLGAATLIVTRTVQEIAGDHSTLWHQFAYAERPVAVGPITRLFAEETLTHAEAHGSLSVSAGAEVESGRFRASLAPGFIMPTVTDPNGIAETLRLRLTAVATPGLQLHADVRQIFGTRPDTSVHVGLGVGFGRGAGWDAVSSWVFKSSVAGVAFFDTNGNGVQDEGEAGLPGVKVVVDGGQTAITDANGRYTISGLRNGTHSVAVDRNATPKHLRLTSASPVAVIVPGGQRVVPFAFAGSAAIHGVVFNDLALSRRFSGVEPGVPVDVLIEGPGVRRRMSASGTFSIAGLEPGRYRVSVDPLSLPPSYVIDEPVVEVDVKAGDVVTAQFPVVALRAVELQACYGASASGACDRNVRPAAGLKVAAGVNGAVATDAQGRVLLRQVPAGRVTLQVDPASVPAGWKATAPVTVDLPDGPSTLKAQIVLEPR
jgi:hypothetical protein